MTKIVPLLFCLGLIFLAAPGCASGPKVTALGYQLQLQSFQGRHIDQMVKVWGPPESTYTYKNGDKEYLFNYSRYVQRYRYAPLGLGLGFGGFYGGHWGLGGYASVPVPYTVHYSCQTRVLTDRRGTVKSFSFQGNACRAPEPVPAENIVPIQL